MIQNTGNTPETPVNVSAHGVNSRLLVSARNNQLGRSARMWLGA
jgi:hypothetical protein